ncbi:RNA polymerase sigma factor [Paenibacillus sp. alder61]|uniref:RNA polymerase sigma factor n=1 Tax=Paenibacillus sp. alder61 TaxID=2862948 RepID=UPI001CD7CECC|nr:RNA polymerase sigma factor [Paenibacillus sp. alder61]MCA1294395.1 RNA polymerase sigma factor [Paenibacillus sp. alder61]
MDLQNDEMTLRLRQMCDGSVEAFDRFYEAYAPFVMQVAIRMVGERMEAEDVCHEVFLEALRRGKDYDPARGSIKAWLAVKTRSRCLDRLRRNQRVQPLEGELLPGGTPISEEEQVISRLEKEALRSAVYALPEAQRKAILGSYYTLHTHKQMSEAWNVPIGTVKSWVRYGLANLRKQLEKQGWSHTPEGGGKDERFRL